MDAAERRTAVGTAGLVGVLVLLLVLAAGLVGARAAQEAPTGSSPAGGFVVDGGADDGGWGYGWCRCNLTGDSRP